MQNPIVSIVIRTKNEEKYIGKVLEALKNQTYKNFEIIAVDNNSTDQTLQILSKNNCKIISINDSEFSHPFSCNIGAQNAQGKFVIFLNGHSIPISDSFIQSGLKHFEDKKVAGVYGMCLAHKDGTLADKLIYNLQGYVLGSFKFQADKNSWGVMGTTNSMIRKDLWQEYNFDEKFNLGLGGEDVDWAKHFLELGYKIIHEPGFRVWHSHHLKISDIIWQLKNRLKMSSSNQKPKKQKKYF